MKYLLILALVVVALVAHVDAKRPWRRMGKNNMAYGDKDDGYRGYRGKGDDYNSKGEGFGKLLDLGLKLG